MDEEKTKLKGSLSIIEVSLKPKIILNTSKLVRSDTETIEQTLGHSKRFEKK